MRRGEIWRYRGVARERLVLVVSDDELNGRSEPIVVDVTETGPTGPMALLTVRLDEWGCGWRCRCSQALGVVGRHERSGQVVPAPRDIVSRPGG